MLHHDEVPPRRNVGFQLLNHVLLHQVVLASLQPLDAGSEKLEMARARSGT